MRWWPVLVVLCGCDLVFEIHAKGPPGEITFVQANATQTQLSALNTTPFLLDTHPGSLMIVGVDWTGAGAIQSLTASSGDELISVGGAVNQDVLTAQLFYAAGITGGPCSVTVEMAGMVDSIEVYVHEYAGIDPDDPFDVASATSSSNNGTMSSGDTVLDSPHELVFAYGVDGSVDPGLGFTARSTFNRNLTQDMISGDPGLYVATAIASSSWTLYTATFRAAPLE